MSAWFVNSMVRGRRENTGKEEGVRGREEEGSGTNTGTNTAINDAVAAATREMDYFKLRAVAILHKKYSSISFSAPVVAIT